MSRASFLRIALFIAFLFVGTAQAALAHDASQEKCLRPGPGSEVAQPEDLRSDHGVLKVSFKFVADADEHGHTRFCYLYSDGAQAPTLRVNPGDELILSLENVIRPGPSRKSPPRSMDMPMSMDSCSAGAMTSLSTNLHFHGLTIPPLCHGDDVLHTVVGPSAAPFEYRFRIPAGEPPGLYWYHPHLHGFTNAQVLGGASGALIVEGIERANRLLAGLPERVLIVRDQELLNPDAAPLKSTVDAPVLRDAEGDILNTGNGLGKPAKDLSINFVPVPYPEYPPAIITTKPAERQLWRVLNASAITYLDLQILQRGVPLSMGVVSLDGVPINENGKSADRILWKSHVLLPPAGRVEFIFAAPANGARATLVTKSVDTGPAGENDPVRPLADIISRTDAPEASSTLPISPEPLASPATTWLVNVKPVRERKLYFSEKPSDPNNPKSPTVFMLTVDGQEPVPYDPRSIAPNLTVEQGSVEDWTIENRSQELHAFHIHQIHFMLLDWNGVPVDEPFLRDTVNVPYWDGKSPVYPSVKLRMDFRDPSIVGTVVYHCHLLEHEDGGMMGTVSVIPPAHAP